MVPEERGERRKEREEREEREERKIVAIRIRGKALGLLLPNLMGPYGERFLSLFSLLFWGGIGKRGEI